MLLVHPVKPLVDQPLRSPSCCRVRIKMGFRHACLVLQHVLLMRWTYLTL